MVTSAGAVVTSAGAVVTFTQAVVRNDEAVVSHVEAVVTNVKACMKFFWLVVWLQRVMGRRARSFFPTPHTRSAELRRSPHLYLHHTPHLFITVH